MIPPSLDGLTALVVDDSPALRQALGSTLRRMGLRTVEAEHGLDAWRRLQELTPDIILTDINMPHLDGLKLIELVRRIHRRPGTPVVVVSSESGPEDLRRAERLGASAFLLKPAQAERVEQVVRSLLAAAARSTG